MVVTENNLHTNFD